MSMEMITKRALTIQSSNYLNEELLNRVCEILSQRDIINVIQTCKFWYQIATPKLYQRIIINGSQCQDNYTLTKLQFDNECDLKFDNWMNFKIPIRNFLKLYQSLNENKNLIRYIKVLEIFDCYKAELRFYIIQILELILSNSDGNFKFFKCHHTTSNQFYYQCLCYQDYWCKLTKYINSNHIENLCLNFNDFIKNFLFNNDDDDCLSRVNFFEIIINIYELNRIDYNKINLNKVSIFFNKVSQLTINNNFEVFTTFINKFDNFKFQNLQNLNVGLEYMNDDVLKFFTKIRYLTKLSLNFYGSDDEQDEFPQKLFANLHTSKLTHLSIKLNENFEIYNFLNKDMFPNLTHLSILNVYNIDSNNFIKLINNLKGLTYFNYQFQISTNWLLSNTCNCATCQEMINLPQIKKLINVFMNDLFSLISPKYDYRYLDQDLNLDTYPIGKITIDILNRINKDNHTDLNMDKCNMILNFIKHIIQITYIEQLGVSRFRYLSIGGVPFTNV